MGNSVVLLSVGKVEIYDDDSVKVLFLFFYYEKVKSENIISMVYVVVVIVHTSFDLSFVVFDVKNRDVEIIMQMASVLS